MNDLQRCHCRRQFCGLREAAKAHYSALQDYPPDILVAGDDYRFVSPVGGEEGCTEAPGPNHKPSRLIS